MNGFLVILSHLYDDFPLAIFDALPVARDFAMQCDWYPPDDHPFGRDCSSPVCISIVTFRNGKPVDCDPVRHFEEEKLEESQTQ